MAIRFNDLLDELHLIKLRLEKAHEQEVRSLHHEIRYLQHLNDVDRRRQVSLSESSNFELIPPSQRSSKASGSGGQRPSAAGSARTSLSSLKEEDEETTSEELGDQHRKWGSSTESKEQAQAPELVGEGAATRRRSKPLGRPPRGASVRVEAASEADGTCTGDEGAQAVPEADESCVEEEEEEACADFLPPQVGRTMSTNAMAAIRVRNQQRLREAGLQEPEHTSQENKGRSSTNTAISIAPANPQIHRFSLDSSELGHYFDLTGSQATSCVVGKYNKFSNVNFSLGPSNTTGTLLSHQTSGLFHPKPPWNIDLVRMSSTSHSIRTYRSLWVNKVPKLARAPARQLTAGSSQGFWGALGCMLMVMHPYSTKRHLWDLFGLMLVAYDCIFIPLQFFEVKDLDIVFMTWVSRIFWSLDILVQCFTGIIVEQRMVLEIKEIFKQYAKSWMIFDLGVVFVEWLTLAVESDDVGDLSDSLRTLRILRFIRLLRLVRIKRVWAEVVARINNAVTILMIGIVRHIITMVIVNHIIACLWYGVGRASKGWNYEVEYYDRRVLYKYLSALHWSLTQFHGATDINPTNIAERGFAVCVCLLALIGFSSFLSSITNMMMQLQQLKSERTRLQQMLCLYLKEHKISPQLSARVKKHVEAHVILDKKSEAVLRAVHLLPRHLLVDLFEEARSPMFANHMFLHHMKFLYPRMVRDVCYLAAEEVVMDHQDIIFSISDVCTSMLFVKQGRLHYQVERVSEAVALHRASEINDPMSSETVSAVTSLASSMATSLAKSRAAHPNRAMGSSKRNSFNDELSYYSESILGKRHSLQSDIIGKGAPFQAGFVKKATTGRSDASSAATDRTSYATLSDEFHVPCQVVQKGQWISEAIMWTHWEFCGELHCVTPGELIALDAEKFGNVVRRYDDAVLQVARYAQDFVERLNNSKQCTDVTGPMMGEGNFTGRKGKMNRTQHDANNVIQTVFSDTDFSVAKIFRQLANRATVRTTRL